MKQRILSFLLSCCLLAGLLPCRQVSASEYVYPEDWSKDALIFAVENGILQGDKDHNLRPENYITRGEMAAVMTRLLGAAEKADLSAYRDVKASDWYYPELSAAVAAGIFNGISASSMEPESFITREQAVVVLCRSFGMVSQDTQAYLSFRDYHYIAPYARDCVSMLKTQGIVNGYTDGTLRPRDYISRAEIAQLIYNLVDCIADSPQELPAKGCVVYRGREALPETLELDGTLILGQGLAEDIVATQWNISQRLILRTGKHTSAQLEGLKTASLVCAPLNGSVIANAPQVYLWGQSCIFTGSCEQLVQIDGKHTVQGSCGTLELRAGSLRLDGDVRAASLLERSRLTLNGQAQELSVDGRYVSVDGTGHAELIVLNYSFSSISISHDRMDDSWLENYQRDYDTALSTVRTMRVPYTVTEQTDMLDRVGGERIKTLPVGTVIYNEWRPHSNWFYASTQDGTYGWVYIPHCSFSATEPTTNGTLDYSEGTKEGFVNLRGYGSKTEYLIWVSLYTQKVMVFQGHAGHWELITTFPCSSGDNGTPTPLGAYEVRTHTDRFNFDEYYAKYPTIFNGDHAFHTILYRYDGSVYDGILGEPRSHGCIRMKDDDCLYIYGLPKGTCVIIY